MADSLDNHISSSHMDMHGFEDTLFSRRLNFGDPVRCPFDVRSHSNVGGRNELPLYNLIIFLIYLYAL